MFPKENDKKVKTLRNILTFISNRSPKTAAWSTAAICILLMAACERRPLEDPDSLTQIRINLVTMNIKNVTCDIYNPLIPIPEVIPEVMHVLFYENESGRVVTENFIQNTGKDENGYTYVSGNIHINPGTYKLLAWNFGTESTIIRNYEYWHESEAYTGEVSDDIVKAYKSKVQKDNSKVPGEETIVYEPDHLFVASNEEEIIPWHEAGEYTIHAEASSVVRTWYLQIKVDGLQYVSRAQAFLTGMAGSNILSENRIITDPPATLYFSLQKSKDGEEPVICNIFNTFGRIENSTNRLEVTFDLRTIDGRTVQKTFDITEEFNSPEAIEHQWLLIEETIKIDPPPNPGGGGMNPSVTEWEEENLDIPI